MGVAGGQGRTASSPRAGHDIFALLEGVTRVAGVPRVGRCLLRSFP